MHECIQQEMIGKFKEFMENTKGIRLQLGGIVLAILVQVGTALYCWGSLTTTVNKNSSYLWGDMTVISKENTRNIDKILAKFDLIGVIMGNQGIQGNQGKASVDK